MESLIVPVGIVVTVLCVLTVLGCVLSMFFSSGVKRPKNDEYTLDQQWDRAPVLFSATDIEPMALARHFEPSDTEGGAAHGTW
ncbi:MAG: hypothetical protein QM774_02580 [Gordonia sp. (in: high G+C Gram-positive bacteria)]|uniref:aa3-type cytochrome oxidase subunit CtaJ n=1 Tax=Gordonia sp. (in: high G+C Gram-positive bacteria) TaxID=84139 RepID=UPI0039E561EB